MSMRITAPRTAAMTAAKHRVRLPARMVLVYFLLAGLTLAIVMPFL